MNNNNTYRRTWPKQSHTHAAGQKYTKRLLRGTVVKTVIDNRTVSND